jgi:L-lactate dehydrogenase complex protein LldG
MSPNARPAILNGIRTALGSHFGDREGAYAALERNYTHSGRLDASAGLALLIERLREYDATVAECAPSALRETIAAEIAKTGRRKLVAPSGIPNEWLVDGIEWLVDRGLSAAEIEATDGVLTAAFCGVADSGTIALHHSPSEGRRILTLLPDWHLCILYASQVVETLPEYFARCAEAPRLATYFSGPSATADIEMTRIKGVHGPRFLTVILVRDDAPDSGNVA